MFNASVYNGIQYNSTLGATSSVPIVGVPIILEQIMGSQIIVEDYKNDVILNPSIGDSILDFSSPNTTIELNSDNNTITL